MRRLAPLLLVLGLIAVIAPPAQADSGELASARAKANKAAAELAAAQTKASELEDQVAELQRQSDESAARLAELQADLKTLAVVRYVEATDGSRDLFGGGGDMNEHVAADALLRLVKEGDQGTVDLYKAEKADFEAARDALASRLDAQKAAVQDLKAKRAAVDAELRRLEELERQRIEAEQQRQAAAASAARAGRSAASGGGGGRVIATGAWVCPVQGPRAFSNDWGQPRSGGRRHQGTDILAPAARRSSPP